MSDTSYNTLLHEMDAAGIPYVFMRDHPETSGLRDLDLLLAESRSAEFLGQAARHGFQLLKDGRLNPGKKVLLRWDGHTPQIIDLHERLIYRGYEYLDVGSVLARRQREGGYHRMSAEDELLTLLLHNVLGKSEIQSKHRDRLAELLHSRLDESYLDAHLRRFGLRELFHEARSDFGKLVDDPKGVARLRRRMLRRLRFRPVMNAARQTRLAWLEAVESWVGPRRGALIVFVGPDGCGKSSITNALRAEFRSATLATDIVYLGPWGQNKLPLHDLMRRLNCKPYPPEDKHARDQQNKTALSPPSRLGFVHAVRGFVFYLSLTIELWYRYLVLVLPRLRRGRVVLGDRYIYDVLIGYKNRPLGYFQKIRRSMCRLYPRPDLTILLDAAPEVIYARKPQFEISELEYIRRAYQGLRKDFEMELLDTSVSVETTLESFRRELLPRVLRSWKP